MAGPFAVFPGQARLAAGSLPLPEAGSDGQQPAAAPMLVTHFAPEKLRPQLEHVTKVFPLAFNLFETFLGAHFPFSTFHQVRLSTCSVTSILCIRKIRTSHYLIIALDLCDDHHRMFLASGGAEGVLMRLIQSCEMKSVQATHLQNVGPQNICCRIALRKWSWRVVQAMYIG